MKRKYEKYDIPKEGETEVSCPHCGKRFIIHPIIVVGYVRTKREGEEVKK